MQFFPLSIVEHLKTYEDDFMHKTSLELPISSLKFIHSTQERYYTIDKVINLSDSLKGKGYEIGYYGRAGHIFEFHTNEYLFINASFKQTLNESIEDAEVLKSTDKMAIFILEDYPSINEIIKENLTFIKQLNDLDFKVQKKDNLIVALKNTSQKND